MDTIIMNPKNGKTSDSHRLLLLIDYFILQIK